LYTDELIARIGGRSRVGIERREENVANCLHVWQVALCVIWRSNEFRKMLVKSDGSGGSFDGT
jgi:hypothetical protein